MRHIGRAHGLVGSSPEEQDKVRLGNLAVCTFSSELYYS